MDTNQLKVLLIIEQCNPEWNSVPLEGYHLYKGISRFVDTTLVTHARNREALEKIHSDRSIVYIDNSDFIKITEVVGEQLSTFKGQIIWPLMNTLTYPAYWEFNRRVYSQFQEAICRGDYDIVHAITPMMPRYPVKVVSACKKTPFILGPVNGGVPFPKGFKAVANREFAYLNFLRSVGRSLIPGYRQTYRNADYILAGSTYTLGLIRELFPTVSSDQLELFYENGITSSFLRTDEDIAPTKSLINESMECKVKLLFVGRLVPYKGADMLLDAIAGLTASIKEKIHLTVVGAGSERENLETQVKQLGLDEYVQFTGKVRQKETLEYYRNSDVFCFPSVREFGGAVVLEAMANALPCIVVNNGGIGEYVTEKTGFKIEPKSRDYVIQELTACIQKIVESQTMRSNMAQESIRRAKEFTWDVKTQTIVKIYSKILQKDLVHQSSERVPEHV